MPEPRFRPRPHSLQSLFRDEWPMVTERYQRDYAWESEEIAEFLGDLDVVIERRAAGDEAFAHFFGALVAVHQERPAYARAANEIVDGQQRLTTFTLLLGVLQKQAEGLISTLSAPHDERAATFVKTIATAYLETVETNQQTWGEEPRHLFQSTERDADVLAAVLASGTGYPLPPDARESHRLMVSAWRQINEHIEAKVAGLSADDALAVILDSYAAVAEGAELIFISTRSRQHAHQLFSVLNDRGRGLEQADLLRSQVLMLASGLDEATQRKVASHWDSIDQFPPITVDSFLRHNFASRYGERLASAQVFKRYVERLFASRSEPVAGPDSTWLLSTMAELSAAMKLYEPISRGDWPFMETGGAGATPRWDRDRLYRLVRTLGSDRVLPLLLAAAGLGKAELRALVVPLERIEFRALICDVEQNQIATMYFDVAALIRARNLSVPQAIEEMEAWVTRWADDRSFRSNLLALEYGTPSATAYIKHLLTSLEDFTPWLDENKPWPPKTSKSSAWDMGQIEDEHIYPQRPSKGVPNRLVASINRLGNQAFWGPSDNKAREASNNLPTDAEKIAAYKRATPKMLNRLAEQLESAPRWGKTEVDARARNLAAAGARVWALSDEARARAQRLSNRRTRLFAWRPEHEVHSWAVPASIDPTTGHSAGDRYRFPTWLQLARSINRGDTLVIYDPGAYVTADGVTGPAVVAVAIVQHLEFTEEGIRAAVYEPDRYRELSPTRPLHAMIVPIGSLPRRPTRILEVEPVSIPEPVSTT